MKPVRKRIEKHYEQACTLALSEVERLARQILANHSNLHEFVMGMGGAIFITKDDDNLGTEDRAYMKPLNDLLMEWDDYLKLTGEPMRFTVDGPIVREW